MNSSQKEAARVLLLAFLTGATVALIVVAIIGATSLPTIDVNHWPAFGNLSPAHDEVIIYGGTDMRSWDCVTHLHRIDKDVSFDWKGQHIELHGHISERTFD